MGTALPAAVVLIEEGERSLWSRPARRGGDSAPQEDMRSP